MDLISILSAGLAFVLAAILCHWIHTIFACYLLRTPNPGFPLPLIGHAHHLLCPQEDLLQRLMDIADKFDKTERKITHYWGHPVLLVYHPDSVQPIFTSTSTLLNKSLEYNFMEAWLGDGLLISSNKKWHTRRKILTPAFHFQILKSALNIFNEQADVLVDVLHQDFVLEKKCGDIFPYVQRAALDMILETAMGVTMGTQMKQRSDYLDHIERAVQIIQQRSYKPWLMIDALFKWFPQKNQLDEDMRVLKGFTMSVIEEKQQQMDEQDNYGNDIIQDNYDDVNDKKTAFLDILLKMKGEDLLSLKDIQDEVDTFMFEGHDTTTCSISWTLFLIGHHPEIQRKLFEEQMEVFGASGQGCHVSADDLTKMKYLEACIKESLRLYPSVPFIGRRAERSVDIDGQTIHKGDTVLLFLHKLHRNSKIWESPHEFIPERFLTREGDMHPYAYVPFSAGARNCVGQKFAQMEEKTLLSKLIRNFKMESVETVDQVKPMAAVVTRPHCGIKMQLLPRVY